MSMLDVLDLPQLYTEPSPTALLDTLELLAISPHSWDTNTNEELDENTPNNNFKQVQVRLNPEGVTRYLTSIVSSSLGWIDSDGTKEAIWNMASLRLSERSGRTAMGDISRKFRIPTPAGSFKLSIHEPALTGDDLGLKTWAASYLLAKRLHSFNLVPSNHKERLHVLELGSGTGLVGLAMASLGADVVLTDLPNICSNLARNAKDNNATVVKHGGSTRTAILDWKDPALCKLHPSPSSNGAQESISGKFPLILAADSLYSPDHPRMLVDTIKEWLSQEADAKVIVEFPYRDSYLPEIRNFRERMDSSGLCVLEEGEETGFDDWGQRGADQERVEGSLVTCWWSCWGRQNSLRR